jgi:oligopeptide/dipeptide ABC transporter ATP-binding protein
VSAGSPDNSSGRLGSAKIDRVDYVVVGAGAIGGTLGARLVRAGNSVLFCDTDPDHVTAMNEQGLAIDLPTGCRFHPRCPIAQHPLCHEADPELLPAAQAPGHLAACHFAWTAAPPAHVPEVELEESA